MDGMHDLGGQQGFGRVRHSPEAQAFHAPWEKRVNALVALAVKHGLLNMDEYRHAIERMEPRHYLSASYYERSMTGLASLCVEKGFVTREELERGRGRAVPALPGRARRGGRTRPARALPARRPRAGQGGLRGRARPHAGVHPRQDRRDRGPSPRPTRFPDAHAHGVPAADEPTYDVRFRSEDLWPNGADPAAVHAGVFESYLEPAP